MAMDTQCKQVARDTGCAPQQLYAVWHQQRLRLLVPCSDALLPYEWRRTGSCTTLGLLFFALGKEYSASQVYDYYLYLKIVALKRKKGKSSNWGSHGKRGSSAAGISGSGIRKGFKGSKEQIVNEYREVTGGAEPGSASDAILTDQAVRHIHAFLLQDMRPPWIMSTLDTQIPSESTLSCYTQASFLQWTPAVARACFGVNILRPFTQSISECGFEDGGIVARPLYACTALKRNKAGIQGVCMSPAAMSPLLEFPEERKAWRCSACLRRDEPVSESLPHRILRLYPLVKATHSALTPMRASPAIAHLYIPPEEFSWGTGSSSASASRAAKPRRLQYFNGRSLWSYSNAESDCIWLSATSDRVGKGN